MRHQVNKARKFNRSQDHRKSLMRNLLTSLISSGKIETTLSKAKELKTYSDQFLSRARREGFPSKKVSFAVLTKKEVALRLYEELLPGFKTRVSGFTRIIKLGRRYSDGAERARIELIESEKEDENTNTEEK